MTTSELIETFIQTGMKAYKKSSINTPEGMKLSRHEPVQIQDHIFSYWREYACYKVGEYILEKIPEAIVTIELNGNDSRIIAELSEEEQRKLNSSMYIFLKSIKQI